jgi:hypothetical protein
VGAEHAGQVRRGRADGPADASAQAEGTRPRAPQYAIEHGQSSVLALTWQGKHDEAASLRRQ